MRGVRRLGKKVAQQGRRGRRGRHGTIVARGLPGKEVLCYVPTFLFDVSGTIQGMFGRHQSQLCRTSMQPAINLRGVPVRPNLEAAPENRRYAMKFLSLIGALAIVIAVAAAVFFFGGFYNVAATQADLPVVAWALEHVRSASINRHAVDVPPVSMEDPAIIQTGARAFSTRGCVACHGGPGAAWAKFSEGLRPDPPDLKDVVKELTPAQIFWVIRNGINMTGMPGFNLVEATDQEIWTIAAFVKKIPDVSEADYKAWTAGAAPPGGEAPPPK
jgi:mono/diheme cytochrome c family protein